MQEVISATLEAMEATAERAKNLALGEEDSSIDIELAAHAATAVKELSQALSTLGVNFASPENEVVAHIAPHRVRRPAAETWNDNGLRGRGAAMASECVAAFAMETHGGTEEVVLMIMAPEGVQIGVRSIAPPLAGPATYLTAVEARKLAAKLMEFADSPLL